MSKIIWVVLFCVVTVPVFGSDDQLNTETVDIDQLIVSWTRISEVLRSVSGRGTLTKKSGEEFRSSTEVVFFGLPDALKCEAKNSIGLESVVCVNANSESSFLLRKTPDQSRFALTKLESYAHSHKSLTRLEDRVWKAGFMFVFSPAALEGRLMKDWAVDKRFEFAEENEYEEDGTVRIGFSFESGDENIVSFSNGFFWLLPEKNWAIQRYECEVEWGGMSGEIEYGTNEIDGILLPKTVTYQLWDGPPSKSELGTNVSFEFDRIVKFTGSLDEFRLTHYGLPEARPAVPVAPTTQKSAVRNFMFFCVVAISIFILLILLFRIKKSRRA